MGTRERVTGWVEGLGRESELGLSSTSAIFAVGELCKDQKGNIYRFVQNITADSVAVADGTCVYQTATWAVVTPDQTGGSAISTKIVGVGIAAIAAGSYGWIQVSGYHDAVKTDGAVSAGEYLMFKNVDGECDSFADGSEEAVFGIALTADTGTEPHSCAAAIFSCL